MSDGGLLGLASVLVSSIALLGVAYSLILQNRALRMNRRHSLRVNHFELLKMVIENPTLLHQGDNVSQAEVRRRLRDLHTNMFLKHFEYGFITGELSDKAVVWQWTRLFNENSERCEFWAAARDAFVVDANTKPKRQFVALIDSAYDQSVRPSRTAGSPTPG